mmetsp:Transcript_59632/g.98934  ORF Transcript_59632/g.98934 Transcript_59632/m.98934 type:complete len:165 (-) Transcript_59632:49-543(-)
MAKAELAVTQGLKGELLQIATIGAQETTTTQQKRDEHVQLHVVYVCRTDGPPPLLKDQNMKHALIMRSRCGHLCGAALFVRVAVWYRPMGLMTCSSGKIGLKPILLQHAHVWLWTQQHPNTTIISSGPVMTAFAALLEETMFRWVGAKISPVPMEEMIGWAKLK